MIFLTGRQEVMSKDHVYMSSCPKNHVYMSACQNSCLHVKIHVCMSKNEESRGLLLTERHGFLIVYCLTPCGVSGDD